ncbi:MAG TPA: ATP synthase F1 subunit epsilon [Aquificales bacterium]|nr:ATP synthase F1 subunit epsilon [Aquificales bacterium]HIO41896.1 ATP synthase F1 subunit epsilon [Aquifex sp.]
MIKVEIVTPKGYAYSGEVELVNIPTEEGEVGVLENHMPLMSSLKPGLVYFNGKKEEGFFVTEGFVEVTPKKVNILAEEATPIGEIDPGEVKKKYEEIVKKLAAAKSMEELREIEKEREIYETLLALVVRK